MGIFGPYTYTTGPDKRKYWLHAKDKGKTRVYYFSKDPAGALGSLPGGYEVVENERNGQPFLRKKKADKK